MMPTSREILASMQLALKEHVEPKLEDKWALSALRSVDALLNHLQARVPVEGAILHEDNADLIDILSEARPIVSEASGKLGEFLDRAPAIQAGYSRTEDLQRLNHLGREAVDEVLRLCRAERDGGDLGPLHDRLRAYLKRHTERESAFFFPVFVGRPL